MTSADGWSLTDAYEPSHSAVQKLGHLQDWTRVSCSIQPNRLLDQGSRKFNMVFWVTEGGCVPVNAETLAEAIEKLEAYLGEFAKDEHLAKRFSVANREWEILEADSSLA